MGPIERNDEFKGREWQHRFKYLEDLLR